MNYQALVKGTRWEVYQEDAGAGGTTVSFIQNFPMKNGKKAVVEIFTFNSNVSCIRDKNGTFITKKQFLNQEHINEETGDWYNTDEQIMGVMEIQNNQVVVLPEAKKNFLEATLQEIQAFFEKVS